MNIIKINTQSEFDALPASFSEFTQIQIISTTKIIVSINRGNSSVEAWGNSSVEARENSSVYNNSILSSIILAGYAAVWMINTAKSVIQKSNTSTIIIPNQILTLNDWLNNQGIDITNGKVILFKRVSCDFKTQEDGKNETNWPIDTLVEHLNYNPITSECGEGKFHACSRPYFCDEFRNKKDDKYIAIEIDIDDLYVWPNAIYKHKIAFRLGRVLYQCDKFGKKT